MEDLETVAQIDDDGASNGLSLINVSATDYDFLLASSSEASKVDNVGCMLSEGVHLKEPYETVELQRADNVGDILSEGEHMKEPYETVELQRVDNVGDILSEGGHMKEPSENVDLQRVDNVGDILSEGAHMKEPSDTVELQRVDNVGDILSEGVHIKEPPETVDLQRVDNVGDILSKSVHMKEPSETMDLQTVDHVGDIFSEGVHMKEPSEIVDLQTIDNVGDNLSEGVQMKEPSQAVEFQRPKYGKCNLRKSLAWDSAFFTSAGVLDPEELSSIIEGAETCAEQKHLLPGIEEDLSKSTDSISTFESDNLTLESLEADLFCDIRASIQRSSRSSTVGNRSSSKIYREEESKNECTKKILEPSSGNMVKPKSASKKINKGVPGPVKTLKPSPVSKQVTKPVVRSRESSSLLPRPSGAAVKPSLVGAVATKSMSIGAGLVKLESISAGHLKGPSVSRKATVRSSISSCESSISSASQNIRKSQSDVVRRKMEKNVNLPAGSKTRTPSRVAVKSKSQTGDCNYLSAYPKSSSKLSSSISPASSISEWSTESSSSTATVNQKLIGLKPCSTNCEDDTTVSSSVSQSSQNHCSENTSSEHENQVTGSLSHNVSQRLTGCAASLSRPAPAKPSGLRMPSAKIGFFDGAKAGTKNPTGGSSRPHSALPSSLPRPGAGRCSPFGAANKSKLGSIAAKK